MAGQTKRLMSQMAEGPRNILICSCEDTVPLDSEKVRRVCRDSVEGDHVEYWRLALDSVGGVTFSPARTFHVTGTAGLLDVRLLSSELAPHVWSNYLHAGAGVDLDRTDDPLFPKGERYRGSFSRYRGIGEARGLFNRVDIDIRQYLPVPSTSN